MDTEITNMVWVQLPLGTMRGAPLCEDPLGCRLGLSPRPFVCLAIPNTPPAAKDTQPKGEWMIFAEAPYSTVCASDNLYHTTHNDEALAPTVQTYASQPPPTLRPAI